MVATYRVGLPRLTERTISRYLVAAPIAYYVFDLLWSVGADITSEIVLDRRTAGCPMLALRIARDFCGLLKEYRLCLPTLQDELPDLERRLVVGCLVLCSWRLSAYSKATVTHQKEYA